MKLLKAIIQAIKEVEAEYNDEIEWYKNRIFGLEKEQELVKKALKENNIQALRYYFDINFDTE